MKRKTKKIVSSKQPKKEPEEIPVEPFYIMFPIKLTHKDGKDEKVCYFMCKEHLQSYVKRYKLKKDQVKIETTPPRITGEN